MPESAKTTKVPEHLKEEWKIINKGLKSADNDQENNGMQLCTGLFDVASK